MSSIKDETSEKMSAREIIEVLVGKLSLIPNKDYEKGRNTHISAYGQFKVNGKDILVRVSDHNTFLYNWIEKNKGVDLMASANYAITFVDKVSFHNKPNSDNLILGSSPPVFVVRQYVYDCDILDSKDVENIVSACVNLAATGVYTDPLEEDNKKHCLILRHKTNTPTKDLTAQIRKRHRKKKLHP